MTIFINFLAGYKLFKIVIPLQNKRMEKASLSFWPLKGGEQGLGNTALLDLPLTAFFSSRQ
jgi:hypothetical protein